MDVSGLLTPDGPAAAILDAMPDVVLVVDEMGRITYASLALEHIFGWERPFWIGRSALDAIHPGDAPLAAARLGLTATDPTVHHTPFQLRVLASNDRWVPVEAHGFTKVIIGDSSGFVISLRDVTGRLALESARSSARAAGPSSAQGARERAVTDLLPRMLAETDATAIAVIVVSVLADDDALDKAVLFTALADATAGTTRATDISTPIAPNQLMVACTTSHDGNDAFDIAQRIHRECASTLSKHRVLVSTGFAIASQGDDLAEVLDFASTTPQFSTQAGGSSTRS